MRIMKQTLSYSAIAFLIAGGLASTQTASAQNANAGHPDLSGTYIYAIDLAPSALKKQVNGKVVVATVDHSAHEAVTKADPHILPSTPAPSYKAELQAKVKDLAAREGKTDPVFYCGRPGVPRIGPPRRVVQLANEMIFLYEDVSGDPYRVFYTDGRAHRADSNPSYYGDSVAHWDGDVLVIDVVNFLPDGWFGENGYIHTDKMHVTERVWKDGQNLGYQVTVDDPGVLATPWTMPARIVKATTLPLEESPMCKDEDGAKLLNNDHHGQR